MITELKFTSNGVGDEFTLEAALRSQDVIFALKQVIKEIDEAYKRSELYKELHKRCHEIVENMEIKHLVI